MTSHETHRATAEARKAVASSTAPVSRHEAAMLHYLNAAAYLSAPVSHDLGQLPAGRRTHQRWTGQLRDRRGGATDPPIIPGTEPIWWSPASTDRVARERPRTGPRLRLSAGTGLCA